MRDWQQDEVYYWEYKWRHWWMPHLSLAACKNWIEWACERYDVPPPKVLTAPKKVDYAGQYSNNHVIRLNKKYYSITTSLHEAAHAIAFKLTGSMDHDALWFGIYIDLLVSARVAPRVALEASAEDEGLKFIKNANPKKVYKLLKTKKARSR